MMIDDIVHCLYEVYYLHFMTTFFEYVDTVIEIELMIPSQMHTKNLRILRSIITCFLKHMEDPI